MKENEKVQAFIEGVYPHTPPSEVCTVLIGFTTAKRTAAEKLIGSETSIHEGLPAEGTDGQQ